MSSPSQSGPPRRTLGLASHHSEAELLGLFQVSLLTRRPNLEPATDVANQ